VSDGRNIDTSIAVLNGEGAHQQILDRGRPPASLEPWPLAPSRAFPQETEPTYYGMPVIKSPVWIWSIPAYFYAGGVAGAGMVMALAAQWFGGKGLQRFDERCRWVGAVGGGIGTALLIHDLGRKARFLYMLRVFRPTSPMSVGSWVLAAATPLSAGSALLAEARGFWFWIGRRAGLGAGILGMPLATYTAVLIAGTAVPVWQQSRRTLPLLFGASSAAGLAATLELMPLEPAERRVMRRFGMGSRAAELVAAFAVERELAPVRAVKRALESGLPGALWNAAKVLTLSSLVLSLWRGKRRAARLLSGILGTAGGLCLRFAVFYAGRASSLDPHATFRQQRAGYGAAEVTGSPAAAGPELPVALPPPRTFEELIDV
jgi:formate-dependent nitrite reductase membrane component NrfD